MRNKSMIKASIKVLNNQLFKESIFIRIYKKFNIITKYLNLKIYQLLKLTFKLIQKLSFFKKFTFLYKIIKYILKFLGYLNIILGASIIIAFNFDMVNIIQYLITNYELLKNVLHKFNQTLIKNIIIL